MAFLERIGLSGNPGERRGSRRIDGKEGDVQQLTELRSRSHAYPGHAPSQTPAAVNGSAESPGKLILRDAKRPGVRLRSG